MMLRSVWAARLATAASVRSVRPSALPLAGTRNYSSRLGASHSTASGSGTSRRAVTLVAASFAALATAYAANGAIYNTVHLDGPSAATPAKRKTFAERMLPREQSDAQAPKQAEDDNKAAAVEVTEVSASAESTAESMDDLSEEASQESAFDPETNTINWDCPCLGGMAHGPCGEDFKKAFSCFVFSEAEPKGIDCVDNFKAMQDCFRRHPEHYKEELDDFDAADAEEDAASPRDAAAAAPGEVTPAAQPADEEDDDEDLREWRAELAKEK